MTTDIDLVDEYLARIRDKYTAYELVEELDLEVDDIIEAFYDLLLERNIKI